MDDAELLARVLHEEGAPLLVREAKSALPWGEMHPDTRRDSVAHARRVVARYRELHAEGYRDDEPGIPRGAVETPTRDELVVDPKIAELAARVAGWRFEDETPTGLALAVHRAAGKLGIEPDQVEVVVRRRREPGILFGAGDGTPLVRSDRGVEAFAGEVPGVPRGAGETDVEYAARLLERHAPRPVPGSLLSRAVDALSCLRGGDAAGARRWLEAGIEEAQTPAGGPRYLTDEERALPTLALRMQAFVDRHSFERRDAPGLPLLDVTPDLGATLAAIAHEGEEKVVLSPQVAGEWATKLDEIAARWLANPEPTRYVEGVAKALRRELKRIGEREGDAERREPKGAVRFEAPEPPADVAAATTFAHRLSSEGVKRSRAAAENVRAAIRAGMAPDARDVEWSRPYVNAHRVRHPENRLLTLDGRPVPREWDEPGAVQAWGVVLTDGLAHLTLSPPYASEPKTLCGWSYTQADQCVSLSGEPAWCETCQRERAVEVGGPLMPAPAIGGDSHDVAEWLRAVKVKVEERDEPAADAVLRQLVEAFEAANPETRTAT